MEQNPADKCCGVLCRQACGLVALLPAVGTSRQFEASQAATVMIWFAEQLWCGTFSLGASLLHWECWKMKARWRAGGDVWKYRAGVSGRRQIEEKGTNGIRETVRVSGQWRLLINKGTDRHKVAVKEISTEGSISWAKVGWVSGKM